MTERTEPHSKIIPPAARQEFIDHPAGLVIELEAMDTAAIAEKIRSYPRTAEGFEDFCRALIQSSDPHTIQVLLFAADHSQLVSDHFVCDTEVLFTGVGRQPHSTLPIVAQLFRKHPKFFSLFSTEYFKYDQTNTTEEWETSYNRARIGDWISSECAYNERDHQLELSREQFEHFVDGLVDYIVHDGYFISAPIIGDFINLYDTDYAVRLLTDQLGNGIRHTASAEYKITSLLACLDSAPAAIADGTCRYLGVDIMLGDLPDGASTVAKLSSYGDVGVKDGDGKWVGHFSLHELQTTDPGTFRALVRALNLEDLFFQAGAEGEMPLPERQTLAREFSEAYQRYDTDPFFEDCGMSLHSFPLKEQAGLIRLLRDGKATKPLADQVHTLGKNVLRIYALASAYNISEPIQIPIVSPPEQQRFWSGLVDTVDQVVDFVKQAETTAGILNAELRRTYPDIELNVEDITRGIVIDSIYQLHTITDVDSNEQYVARLAEHSKEVALGLTFFREVIGLIQVDDVDLHDFVRRQQALTRLVDGNPILHGALVDVLLQCQKLTPDPELFWRVDRELREYNDRTGIRVTDLAKTLAIGSAEKEIFFESGAGAGRGIAERTASLSGQYYDFSINNNVYYPLRKLLTKCIDFEALQLPEAERDDFVDYIFKVLYLVEGAGGGDATTDVTALHDQAAITSLTADPNNLKKLLATVGSKLQLAEVVPSEYGIQPQADGSKVYPNKIRWREQSKTFQAAIEKFQANPASSLRPDLEQTDLKQIIPIFPIGMTIGDFTEINKLADNQIKCGVDVRALMYLEGEAYINTLVTLGHKLKDGAVYVSDSVRENFGKVYRLPELRKVEQELGTGYTLYVVTGPGVPGDDYNQTAAVRSVVITKGNVPENLLHDHLTSGAYNLSRLDAVLIDEPYLRSLDVDGANLGRLQAAAY